MRAMKEEDIDALKVLHRKHFAQEFEFPDFEKFFLNALIVEDEFKNIITAGGVRVILEAVAVTNMDMSVMERADGLSKLMSALTYTAHRDGFNQIHAFVQNESWKKVLKNRQFKPCKGEALVFSF